ncbi:alkaline phosphatase PhoX [Halorussus sp. AFM4]|uniref:alkaline phosphatase PhoX n=1 Tax=Halorussus sp. AFM4 TaxID=3421651 RepID=UPI003EBFE21C
MVEFTRRQLMATSVAATLGASVSASGALQDEDADTPKAPSVKGEIKRFATTALGAEVTGPEVSANGTLFFSLQHPSRKNPAPYNKAGIGYVRGYEFTEGSEFDALGVPSSNEAQGRVRVAGGSYELLAQEGDNIGGNETLGMPVTPDNLAVEEYPGARYGNFGYNPDCNRLIPTNEAETRGYLFTNWEESPGNVTRIPVSRKGKGRWEADLRNAANLANTEALRSIGGTRINCYGDISPWGTYLSAEEDYAHPRVALTTKVSDVVGDSKGPDHRGAAQFYNRPNPSSIQEAVDRYYGDNAWFVQGYWALAGLEIQAYYLGAEAVDENQDLSSDVDPKTNLRPLGSPYPNPYRYGHIVDFRQPAAETPQPVKYHAMGRAAWECPDVQSDEKTVYLTSDGDNKGLYKFVADRPIPSYDDPTDVAGTLYAAKVTNQQAAADNPPAEVPLEIEWLEMGHATNREVESWIAEYDDVNQVDYLETHAETDWKQDIQQALEEADRTVVKQGNQNYISDRDIVKWARQYDQRGPGNVDEELRRVPFLETRAAAKEIDATVEFRKSEGIDSRDGAQPGDYVYVGISEVNDGMSDSEGDINVDRVDGGLVYRATLEQDYNISTLEPVIVGPDATDPADVANDALLNIDNVFVMNDGRVLCCEDADQYGRSFPNDCMYVYTPAELTSGATETGTETGDGDARTTAEDGAAATGTTADGEGTTATADEATATTAEAETTAADQGTTTAAADDETTTTTE